MVHYQVYWAKQNRRLKLQYGLTKFPDITEKK